MTHSDQQQHVDEQARKDMLGHGGGSSKPPTVFGLPVREALLIASLIFVGGGLYWQLLDVRSALSVEPAAVQRSVQELQSTLTASVNELKTTIETTRVERNQELRELQQRINAADTERAKIGAQVSGLERLMEDIRDIMRRQEGWNEKSANGKG